MDLLFASSNVNKLEEIRQLMPEGYNLKSLADFDFKEELVETTETLEGNALQKAHFVFQKFGINCFSDDSGLEVEQLNGRPGVHSAFYAGFPRNDSNNIKVLLTELGSAANRKARFRTVIAFVGIGKEFLFEGILDGTIARYPLGGNGFGYDSVFIPLDLNMTMAELNRVEKNKISHRSKALKHFLNFLSTSQS